jgi:hypothetical protein
LKANVKKFKTWLISLAGLAIILLIVWILLVPLEGERPSIKIELPSSSVGAAQRIFVSVADGKSGLRRTWIGLIKDGKENILLEKDFPAAGFIGGGEVREESFEVMVDPKKLEISDGKAILRLAAWDFSWRHWWHGNSTYVEKELMIDTRPPEVDILTRVHNVSQGGAGLVIYKISESCPENGVYVGKNYFPGHSGYFKDPDTVMAFFALDYTQGPGTPIFVKATDPAGNITRAGFPYYIRQRTFKNDILNISDSFLNEKMPEFDIDIQTDNPNRPLAKFLKVNGELRKENFKKIVEIGKQTDRALFWEGEFLRLPKAAPRAGFADHREYRYKGRVIDHQVHMGVDLASVSQSPVPAANNGKVVFAENLGIYGRTVIIDHGFGLFSMYAHLSQVNAENGQNVSKGDVIGRTGITGLAGGDHLHFGMFIHNTFVNPLEWWDNAWIQNNISSKIETVSSLLR